MDAITELRHQLVAAHGDPSRDLDLRELGELHRALKAALVDVETALVPAVVGAAQEGMTYTELAVAAGYGSSTTIVKIMREAGASPGRGRNQPQRRHRAA